MAVDISIILPVYNEKDTIVPLWERLSSVKQKLQRSCEVVFVDDGSSDGSYPLLLSLQKQNDDVKVIRFKKNFGQTAAIAAGFRFARGGYVVTMDADLQNDPEDIPCLIDELEKGYDIVSGWRKERKDSFLFRRLPSMIANAIISKYTGVSLHDYGCTLKAYRQHVIKDINLFGELHRFIPALMSWSGASIQEIPVRHHPRQFGTSKYGLGRTVNVILDLITVKFLLVSTKGPMQVFGRIGLWYMLFGLISGVITVLMKVICAFDMTGNPLLYLAVFLVMLGLQFFSVGLLSELNIRIYNKTQDREIYKIDTIIG